MHELFCDVIVIKVCGKIMTSTQFMMTIRAISNNAIDQHEHSQ